METKLIQAEIHPPGAGNPQMIIQQVVTDWLTRELAK